MSAVPIVDRLPEEYSIERGNGAVLAIRSDWAPALRAAGYGLETDGASRPSSLAGRRPLYELPTAVGTLPR